MVGRATLRQSAFALAALLGPTSALATPQTYEVAVPRILADVHAYVGEAGVEAPPLPRDPTEFDRDLVHSKSALRRTLAMIAARKALVHRDPAFELLVRLASFTPPRELLTR